MIVGGLVQALWRASLHNQRAAERALTALAAITTYISSITIIFSSRIFMITVIIVRLFAIIATSITRFARIMLIMTVINTSTSFCIFIMTSCSKMLLKEYLTGLIGLSSSENLFTNKIPALEDTVVAKKGATRTGLQFSYAYIWELLELIPVEFFPKSHPISEKPRTLYPAHSIAPWQIDTPFIKGVRDFSNGLCTGIH